MLYGVRYFDIRVALNPDLPEKYRIVHNIFWADTSISNNNDKKKIIKMKKKLLKCLSRSCLSTDSLLEDVVRFLVEFSKEFIILDFHNFQMGMTNRESYRDLLALIDVSCCCLVFIVHTSLML